MIPSFEEVYDLTELAIKVQEPAGDLGLKVEVRDVENPRFGNYYNPEHQILLALGYKATHGIEAKLRVMP